MGVTNLSRSPPCTEQSNTTLFARFLRGVQLLKQKMYQQYIYKFPSSRIFGNRKKLKSKKPDFKITLREARLNGEVISLADSNVLRAIDELNGVDREATAAQIADIRAEIKCLRESPDNRAASRKRISELYAKLDEIQLKTDYLEVVMSKPSDFDKLNEGFSVNGVEFRRLVGTPNGVKQSVVAYCPVVNENGIYVHDELNRRMNGGRDESKPLVPAKFEAYKALACSASVPVSEPRDILVVDDFVLSFEDNFIELKDAETDDGEPIMTEKRGEFELNASDGFGLICPALAERWSKELELDYTAGGMCIRNLFCKGMVYAFDFHEFARRFCDSDTIADVWGNVHTISDVEIILPVSVMKLWDSYPSLERYLECCREYGHGFAVTKVCERELENERTLNYQFIQSYDLTDDEIKELVQPSIDEIKETICGDADKTLLYLRGACGRNYDFDSDTNYLAKAIMIDRRVAKDPYAVTTVYNMIKKRIDDLKIGKVKVRGNYTVISGDPFAFCQKIFGCDVPDNEKGLLKAGEIYSKYWVEDCESKRVVCFRAPMSVHNNIRTMRVVRNEDVDFWYRYMPTVNIINCHDMFYPALNGADNDGDAILVTDNEILLRNTRDVPAIVCVQKKAEKSVITEELLAQSNKLGFGDEIGAITNRVTAMYDIMTQFDKDTDEYRTLEYRIKCGQMFQQAEIDKIKGIVCRPMSKQWYEFKAVAIHEDEDSDYTKEQKEFNRRILADKKPYFMIYIYSEVKRELNDFVKSANRISLENFLTPIEELLVKENKTEAEQTHVDYYNKRFPISYGDCVMNRLCRHVEQEFDGYVSSKKTENINYPFTDLLVSRNYESNIARTVEVKKIREIFSEFTKRYNKAQTACIIGDYDDESAADFKNAVVDEFLKSCYEVCSSDERLCDILLKIGYTTALSKKLIWNTFGRQICQNLSEKYSQYSYFAMDKDGETVYRGQNYEKIIVDLKETSE